MYEAERRFIGHPSAGWEFAMASRCSCAGWGTWRNFRVLFTCRMQSPHDLFKQRIAATSVHVSSSAGLTSTKRFIAVCDILGFKELIRTLGLKAVQERYTRVLESAFRHAGTSALSAEVFETIPIDCSQDYAVFSDTILIWSETMERSARMPRFPALQFFMAVNNILNSSFWELPMRVGIAYGDVIISKPHNLFLGQPIIDAHLLEGAQEWIGGACHASCHIAPGFHDVCENRLVNYLDVPTKKGFERMFALHWSPGINIGTYCNLLESMKNGAPPCAHDKYDQTLAHVKSWSLISRTTPDMHWFAPDPNGAIVEHAPRFTQNQ